MGKIKDLIRSLTPGPILEWNRRRKKVKVREKLDHQRRTGEGYALEDLVQQLKSAGIQEGDSLLVHTSLSKMGYVEGGPGTVVDALIQAVGDSGNLLMPTSPNPALQLEYIRSMEVFDVRSTPSQMGSITENFRRRTGVLRSVHPTEPVAAMGPDAEFFTSGHLGEITPYTEKSPFYRVVERRGKILMIGVTLDNAGTNLHTLEDAVDFKFPVYYDDVFEVDVIDHEGKKHTVKTKVHNPEFSKKRKCDRLIPMFEEHQALEHIQIGDASTLLIDAKKMFETMVLRYKESGVTMYTPEGS